ncbi:MAG: hypothetical protein QM727_02310 [Niabella sp.]
MKLLIITAVEAFEEKIKTLLIRSGVKAFSYMPVRGYKNDSAKEQSSGDNWFASNLSETDSLLFWAMVPEEQVNGVYESIEHYNEKQPFLSKIHVTTLSTEKYI